jgi:hypothetical protein
MFENRFIGYKHSQSCELVAPFAPFMREFNLGILELVTSDCPSEKDKGGAIHPFEKDNWESSSAEHEV